jgi:ATP-dependent DNA helicase DinG
MRSGEFYRYLLSKGYEERRSQIEMISLCEEVIEGGGVKLIEAPTGTGKTFAYLIPLITSGSKAIISTGTKVLQDQLKKDMEFLTAHWKILTGEDISFTVIKGKANYLCLDRLRSGGFSPHQLGNVPELMEKAWDGDLTLATLEPEVAGKINVDEDHCTRAYREVCPYRKECYYWEKLKEKERNSRFLIVNHALLALKEFDETTDRVLVIDEAHELDRYLTLATTAGISLYWAIDVKNSFEKALERELKVEPEKLFRELFEFLFEDDREEVAVESASSFARALNKHLLEPFKTSLKELIEGLGERVRDFIDGRLMISYKLKSYLERTLLIEQELISKIKSGYEEPTDEEKELLEKVKRLEFLDRKVQKLSAFLRLCSEEREEVGFKVSRTWSKKLQTYNYRLEAFPVFPRDVVEADRYRGVILTSATVDPEDIEFTTGIRGDFHRLSWNFDYSRVTFLIKRTNPKREDWESVLKESLEELTALYDRVLVLLTNRQHLKLFNGNGKLKKQGEDSLQKLLEDLRRGKIRVLVGLDSLWTGIDVKGEKGILMSKLPFDSPDDPVTFHRIRFLRERGEDPFLYQKRKAFLKFRQGVGRLMRSKEDGGTIVICDNRVWRYKEFTRFLKELGVLILYDRPLTARRTWGRPY